jgi:uncharacterized glyoxalase superfamily protein PhnB
MTGPQPSPATLHAYLSYRDAPAALRWLERAFGFTTTMEYPDDRGGVMHAEMSWEDISFSVFTDHDGYDRPVRKGETVGHGLWVCMPSQAAVDAVHASAVAAGGTIVWEPAMTEWGNYRCRVLDPEGYEWTWGTYRPGLPQVGWE